MPDSFVCPVCRAESHHTVDVATGWCAACHLFTGKTAREVRAAARRMRIEGTAAGFSAAASILYRLGRYGVVHTIDSDSLWPRDERHRYRLYARVRDELRVLAAAPDAGGIGVAIVQLHDDAKEAGRRLADEGQIGVLDVMPDGKPSPRGEWVVLPFSRDDE